MVNCSAGAPDTSRGRAGDETAAEILAGLQQSPRFINSRFLYDERGSRLFDRITQLPEYYPTRTEVGILQEHGPAIAELAGASPVLIEPGAGSCEKVLHLLERMRPSAYVPQDISVDYLHRTARRLKSGHPWLRVAPVSGDFVDGVALPADLPEAPRVVFYPGSTIGNFQPAEAVDFLTRMRALVGDEGGIILGADLQKPAATLHAAYNDSEGITAEFNRNILRHAGRLLDAEFVPEWFDHHAFYNAEQERVEMHLVCRRRHKVTCAGTTLVFARGDDILTEYSHKYTLAGVARMAADAGLRVERSWTDAQSLFSVNYLRPLHADTAAG